MFSRKLRRIAIFLTVVMLMSSQYAVASYVCPKMSPMEMIETDMSGMNMPADCMHEMESASAPLCKAHCDQTPQSNEVPSVTLAPFVVMTQWSLAYIDTADSVSSRNFHNTPAWQSDGSPPLRIQFQVFRI